MKNEVLVQIAPDTKPMVLFETNDEELPPWLLRWSPYMRYALREKPEVKPVEHIELIGARTPSRKRKTTPRKKATPKRKAPTT